jgi:SAM-dependent methyltransferase
MSNAGEAEHKRRLDAEANAFSGKHNDKVRAAAMGSIAYFGHKLNEELNVVTEAVKLLSSRTPIRALTMACGDMKGEYNFFKKIGATSIDAFDVSSGQRDRCLQTVYDGAIELNYGITDVNAIELKKDHYDVVYMQQSLHHIEKVERTLVQIHDSLTPDGIFVLSDYIGEPFLQRGPKQREVCAKLWSCLPKRLRMSPHGLHDTILIPPKNMLSPFEAIHSDAIVPALETLFRIHKQIVFAGLLFPIFNNFAQCYDASRELDDTLIKLMWELDKIMVGNGTVEPTFIRGIFLRRASDQRPGTE